MQKIKRVTGEEKSIGRRQFARELSVILGYPINDCLVFVDTYNRLLTELIKKDISVRITGFGTYSKKLVSEREYHNVQYQGKYVIKPAHSAIRFKPSPSLIEELNEE